MSIIEKSIEFNVPVYTAYGQWIRFGEYPQFLEGVKEVKQLDRTRIHWTVEIAGHDQEWDAEITEQKADQQLAWTCRGGAIKRWTVTFHELARARGKVKLQLEYEGNELEVVSSRVQGDLERFKALIENRWKPSGPDSVFDIIFPSRTPEQGN